MENKEIIIEEYNKGLSIAYISRKNKISTRQLYKFLKEENIYNSDRPKINKPPKHDLKGQKFNHLLVLEMKITEKSKDRSYRCWCVCDCGRECDVNTNYLMRGLTKTCGHKDCEYHRQDYSNNGKNNIRFTGYEEISGQKWASYRLGAERRNLSFDISIEEGWNVFLQQDKKCKLTNIPIFFGKTNTSEVTASLDRIDSSKGYIKGNIQWVHKDVNKMKMDLDLNKFIFFCKKVADNNE